MNPIGTEVNQVAVGKPFLYHAASKPVAAFDDCDTESILAQNVCATQAGQASAHDAYMRLTIWTGQFPLKQALA